MNDVSVRLDHRVIASLVEPGSKVLDLGCGDGELMRYLERTKNVRAQGIELDEKAIYACVEKGLSVYHSDIDSGLASYPDGSFDYVVLNQSMQQVRRIGYVLGEALRVGGRVVVGFPNFAHLSARLQLFFKGRAPVTRSLPGQWYDSPNIRFLSTTDFTAFCRSRRLAVRDARYLGRTGELRFLPNLRARSAVFVVTR